jgi:hypothetical protein
MVSKDTKMSKQASPGKRKHNFNDPSVAGIIKRSECGES